MADGEASGEQRLDVPVEPGADHELVFQPIAGDGVDGHFDPFDATTWHFKPAPEPWHRTGSAVLGLVAVGVAVVVLVVSVVVLSIRSGDDAVPARRSTTVPAPSPTTASTTASAAPVETGDAAPPPAPQPVPPSVLPRTESRPTKKPEFNVTRAPISVSPQPRGGSR